MLLPVCQGHSERMNSMKAENLEHECDGARSERRKKAGLCLDHLFYTHYHTLQSIVCLPVFCWIRLRCAQYAEKGSINSQCWSFLPTNFMPKELFGVAYVSGEILSEIYVDIIKFSLFQSIYD